MAKDTVIAGAGVAGVAGVEKESYPEPKNTYTNVDEIDPELHPLALKGLEKYRMFKMSEEQTSALKQEYTDLISPVLMALGEGKGVDFGEGIGKAYLVTNMRANLNQQKLRGLLLDALMHVPNIGDILTKCFTDATSQTSSTYPMVRLAKEIR